eukprot:gb/GECH01010579.1/.p1 GENE.gb/GECH01010579.1/~~gb/GECH01010579.1/.p1  ORF type:complete len:478 (+),score=115.71 gb/GECH01010579.1/:1-1434(+)
MDTLEFDLISLPLIFGVYYNSNQKLNCSKEVKKEEENFFENCSTTSEPQFLHRGLIHILKKLHEQQNNQEISFQTKDFLWNTIHFYQLIWSSFEERTEILQNTQNHSLHSFPEPFLNRITFTIKESDFLPERNFSSIFLLLKILNPNIEFTIKINEKLLLGSEQNQDFSFYSPFLYHVLKLSQKEFNENNLLPTNHISKENMFQATNQNSSVIQLLSGDEISIENRSLVMLHKKNNENDPLSKLIEKENRNPNFVPVPVDIYFSCNRVPMKEENSHLCSQWIKQFCWLNFGLIRGKSGSFYWKGKNASIDYIIIIIDLGINEENEFKDSNPEWFSSSEKLQENLAHESEEDRLHDAFLSCVFGAFNKLRLEFPQQFSPIMPEKLKEVTQRYVPSISNSFGRIIANARDEKFVAECLRAINSSDPDQLENRVKYHLTQIMMKKTSRKRPNQDNPECPPPRTSRRVLRSDTKHNKKNEN